MKGTELQYMLLISDSRGKRKFPLGGTKYTLGRESDNTIQIYSRFVSRHHAALLRIPSSEVGRYNYRILDGNTSGKPSVNGVLINDKTKVNSYDLQSGDVITLAPDVELQYLIVDLHGLDQDKWSGFESLQERSEIEYPATQVSDPSQGSIKDESDKFS